MSAPHLPYRFRPGVPADADTILATVTAGFETYRAFASPDWNPPTDVGPDVIRDRVARDRTWVLMAETLDAQPAGHVGFTPAAESRFADRDPELVHLWQLFVRSPHWGSGLATSLLRQAREEAITQGYTLMRLHTPTFQARARTFYEREGFATSSDSAFEAQLGLDIIEYRCRLG